jgi:hypothetical protein
MTQQAIPETEPAELTGIDGHIAAISGDPARWQAKASNTEWLSYGGIAGWGNRSQHWCGNTDTRWRRIHDPKPVDSELPEEMTAEQAEIWLRGHTLGRVAMDRDRDLWWFDGQEFTNSVNVGCGESLNQEYAPYRPLAPLTRGQLAEIERLTKRVNELVDCHEQDKKLISEARTRLLDATTERDDARAARDSAIGSQKAALAALEQERQVSVGLREKLRVVRNWFDNDVNNLRGRDIELSQELNASVTRKESGG